MWSVWLGSFIGTALGFVLMYCVFRYCVRLHNWFLHGQFTKKVDFDKLELEASQESKAAAGPRPGPSRTERLFR